MQAPTKRGVNSAYCMRYVLVTLHRISTKSTLLRVTVLSRLIIANPDVAVWI